MGVEASSIVPSLVQALKNQNTYVRRRAADALGHIASFSSFAVPALTEALKDRDSEVRASAASALKKIAPGSQ
jgi:HEAT repeat protein